MDHDRIFANNNFYYNIFRIRNYRNFFQGDYNVGFKFKITLMENFISEITYFYRSFIIHWDHFTNPMRDIYWRPKDLLYTYLQFIIIHTNYSPLSPFQDKYISPLSKFTNKLLV